MSYVTYETIQDNKKIYLNQLINEAERELLITKKLRLKSFLSLIKSAPQYETKISIIEDSKNNRFTWNFSMPKKLTVDNSVVSNKSSTYRFVINKSGTAILGYADKFEQTRYQNIFQNVTPQGILIASHAALNDYQPVIAAGNIFFDKKLNIFSIMDNYSGHYMPDETSLKIAKIIFQYKYGHLFSKVQLNLYRGS